MIINFIITLYFYEFFLIVTIINFLFSLIVFPLPFLGKYLHISLSFFSKYFLLFISGCRLEILNKLNIDKKAPLLIICNHQSLFDIIILFSVFLGKIQFKWIIKKSLFDIPLFGFIIKEAGYIKLNRKNKYKAYKAIKKAIHYMNNNISVMIFPEGTRSLTDTIQEFKSGSMVIATHTGSRILPIILKNTLYIKSKKSFFIQPMPIKIKILDMISVSSKMKKNQKAMLASIQKKMLKEYKKI